MDSARYAWSRVSRKGGDAVSLPGDSFDDHRGSAFRLADVAEWRGPASLHVGTELGGIHEPPARSGRARGVLYRVVAVVKALFWLSMEPGRLPLVGHLGGKLQS